MNTKTALQCAVGICGLVPVLAGLAGVVIGQGMLDGLDISNVSVDSHFRYLSGLLLAIGIGFWTTIPDIEYKTQRFQILTALVVIGGIGRLYGLITVGLPDKAMLFALAMELSVTPCLAVWQAAVAKDLS